MGREEYRPDIDGLRANAVAIVVLHHVRLLRGGFIGVDIFFVISGFLITRIILREIEDGSFTLTAFYRRRVRRLFPALFAMFAASSIASVLLLFPNELVEFGKALASATFFVANIFFYRGDGYFAEATDIVPLLHTWSLSVEEQFYIVFPLLILATSRLGSYVTLLAIGVLLLLSFALSVTLIAADQSAAFFLFPPRAWELLLGCALGARLAPPIPAHYRDPAAAVALAALLLCAAVYDKDMSFPGWSALAPCAAAAVLIHSASSSPTRIASFLSTRPLVYVGLISYSLYLWHWPIIVFYKAGTGHQLTGMEKCLLVVASLVVAHLSYRFVERPFREGSLKTAGAFSYSIAAASLSCLFFAIVLFSSGFASLYSDTVRRLAEFRYDYSDAYRSGTCFKNKKSDVALHHVDEACLALDSSRRDFLILGDSHAAHYWAGFKDVFPEINFLQATASGCKPTLKSDGVEFCREFMNKSIQFLRRAKVDAVILSARWDQASLPDLEETLHEIIKLAPATVILGPIAAYSDSLPKLLARAEYTEDDGLVRRARKEESRAIDRNIAAKLEPFETVRYISVIDLLCDGSFECITVDREGLPIQFDSAHLTRGGAAYIAQQIRHRRLFEVSPLPLASKPH
jgi:peptidoglycan/LPS O-acetylase OafA/YrhL